MILSIDEEIIQAAGELVAFIEAGKSLRHPDHAVAIEPIKKRVKAVMARYFNRQKAAILDDIRLRFWHHEMPLREDSGGRKTKGQKRAEELLPESLSPLTFSSTHAEDAAYQYAIQRAIAAAQKQVAAEIEYDGTIGENTVTKYLEEHSLSKLTGDIAETTKQRLRSAIADAVDGGGNADDIVESIQNEMADFSDYRANLIAQTEVNAAYNFGRHALADEAGMNEKKWATENITPCLVCIANQLQGWIPITDNFLSGDTYPPGHPGCYCNGDYRLNSRTKESSLKRKIELKEFARLALNYAD